MDYKEIKVEYESSITTLILNRPEKLNALNTNICLEMIDLIKTVNDDDDVKVLIITGAGRDFCVGADLCLREKRLFPGNFEA